MNRVLQPRPLVVLGLNVWMGTAAGADELVEIPYREFRPGPKRTPFFLSTSTSLDERGSFRNYSHADESSFQVSQKPPSHTRLGPQCNLSPTLVGPQEITRKKRKENQEITRKKRKEN